MGPEILREISPTPTCHVSCVTCHVSNATCHVTCVIFFMEGLMSVEDFVVSVFVSEIDNCGKLQRV